MESKEWITKRMSSMRQRNAYWDEEELFAKVKKFADPRIEQRRWQSVKAKTLQDELSYLFDEKVRSDKESHLLIWMICIYMHTELEKNSTGSLPPLYTESKMSSIFNFIYHLATDLGNVAVMKALAQRGHSPRLYQCEEGTLHYPNHTHTLWADVGNATYGHMNQYLDLVSDAPGINPENAGDVIEIAYNLDSMYATLNIDVAPLLGVDQSVLQGWWAQVKTIQRDAYIQSASMMGGKGCSTARFEQVCIYVSGLAQLTSSEAISNVRGKESHVGSCPVPYCYVCGTSVGHKGETESISTAVQPYWSHTDNCMKQKMYSYHGKNYYTPLQIPGNYYPNMDHVELIKAQLTKEGMLAYDSIAEASIAGSQR